MNSLSRPSSRTGRKREGPQFNRRACSCVPSPEPRWTDRLHMAVASPTVVAFANFAVARHPQDHARWFLRGSCNEADRFTCVTARTIASPHQHGTFTVELSPGGSPQPGVDYDYAGKQPIPATGLAPARYTALWAANETAKVRKRDWKDSVVGGGLSSRGSATKNRRSADSLSCFLAFLIRLH
jgi:hypothetical protein